MIVVTNYDSINITITMIIRTTVTTVIVVILITILEQRYMQLTMMVRPRLVELNQRKDLPGVCRESRSMQ